MSAEVTLDQIEFDRREMAVLLANMLEAHLASGEPPQPETEDRDELENHPQTSSEIGLRLHSPVVEVPGSSPSREQPRDSMRCARKRSPWDGLPARFASSTGIWGSPAHR